MANYDRMRIISDTAEPYLLNEFPQYNKIKRIKKHTIEMTPFLQSHYGDPGDGDCTLCSIMTQVYYFLNGKYDDNTIYNFIRPLAKKYFFTNQYGTIPIFAQTIFNQTLKNFGLKRRVRSFYFKNIGYNIKFIKKQLDKNIPILFSIFKDGRNYYTSHSITIIGYETFRLEKSGLAPKNVDMLIVYDNWSKTQSYVDYNKVSTISSIYC